MSLIRAVKWGGEGAEFSPWGGDGGGEHFRGENSTILRGKNEQFQGENEQFQGGKNQQFQGRKNEQF